MNNEPVSRKEFDRLLGYANTLADLLREQNRIVGEHLANSGRLTNRLAAAERLLDGVKDAVCFVSEFVPRDRGDTPSPPKMDSLHGKVCRIISTAQQPPATATGEPVVIDPAASAAAETNARAIETWLLNDDAPPPAQTNDVP